MHEIRATEIRSELHIAVPYALKDSFRQVFKTAKWNHTSRTWIVKNTTANKNKLTTFRDSMAPALAGIELSDEVEITEAELGRLREEAIRIQESTAANEVRITALRREIASVRDEIALLRPALADTSGRLESALAELESVRTERLQILGPVKALCDAHGVNDAISELRHLSKCRYLSRPQKEEVYRAQDVLRAAREAVLATFGIRLEALDELESVSANRLDSLLEALRRHADIFRSVELAETE